MPVVEAVPEPDPLGPLADRGHELVVDARLDDRPAARRADLARVDERRGQRVIDGGLEIGVGEHDVRALAAELERDALHVHRGAAHQRAPGLDATGQGDEVDVRAESASACPTRSPGPRTRLTTPRGDAGLLEQAGQVDRRQRRQVGGFMTAVHPAASAGAIFHDSCRSG